jgi:hypothetical protein
MTAVLTESFTEVKKCRDAAGTSAGRVREETTDSL